MASLINVKLKSVNDGEETFIESKGYEKTEDNTRIVYFNSDHKYKFIVGNDEVEVYFDESYYHFKKAALTEGVITSDDVQLKIKINTKKLEINDDYIFFEYELNFGGFVTENEITLELH